MGGLSLKSLIKTHEKKKKKKKQNPYKSAKPIPIWKYWYPKNNSNPSKFRNLNFGEITNQTINRNQNKPQGWEL